MKASRPNPLVPLLNLTAYTSSFARFTHFSYGILIHLREKSGVRCLSVHNSYLCLH